MNSANDRFPRVLRRTVEADLSLYPVVAVMGARQVGKSTLCRDLADNLGFAHRTLDDSDVRDQAIQDPEGFLDELGDNGAFIDEIQRAPALVLALKAVVDREQRPGRYMVSGSNQPQVGKSVGDSLLGRAAYRTLYPLTLSELRYDETHSGWSFLFGNDTRTVIDELTRRAEASGELDWRDVVRMGGFPRAVAAPSEQRLRILDDYVQVYSSRDIRDLIAVESNARFEAFLRVTAARTGQVLNASGLSNDLGIPVNTIRRWIDALQRSYLVNLVPAFSRNASQRVIKAPKVFMVDAALALAAAREAEPSGFHLENLIETDLQVWKAGAPGRGLSHWRLSVGQEVDFVLEEGGAILPLEIKASESVDGNDARHLMVFRDKHPNSRRGVILSCDRNIREVRPGILACPWWAVL